MKILIFIIALFIVNTSVAKQKFYKWTDENGNTHYTSEKPENKKTDEIKVNTNQPNVPQNVRITEEVESRAPPEKSYLEKHYEKKEKAKESVQKNNKNCQQAKQVVIKYQQKVRMATSDKKTGERVFLEDDQRADIIKEAKKAVKKYCK
jgi:hypothetical protein